MTLFSEREGFSSPPNLPQLESASHDLRVGIYNELFAQLSDYFCDRTSMAICKGIWGEMWHLPIDTFPSPSSFALAFGDQAYDPAFFQEMKERVFKGEWFAGYDLVEYVAETLADYSEDVNDEEGGFSADNVYIQDGYSSRHDDYREFSESVNKMFERERSGYRLIGGQIVQITIPEEIAELEKCLDLPDAFGGARLHITSALEKLAIKPDPDLRNAIKEAVLAVESTCRVITGDGKATLGDALKKLKGDGGIHRALADGWGKLYGYTSDESGIRHGAIGDDDPVDGALARYMVIACSAFVNYLVEEHSS